MNRIYVDLDGVTVDFDGYKALMGMSGEQVKKHPGAYLAMKPMTGALDSIRSLIGMGFEVWIATKPPTGLPFAYADKVQWVLNYLPELKRRIVITHDKGMLGDEEDYLIDDRPHKANCEQFKGKLVVFRDGNGWPEIIKLFKPERSSAPLHLIASCLDLDSGGGPTCTKTDEVKA